MIFYILGKMMGVEGIVLLIPAFVSLLYQEKSGFSFLIVSAVLILIYFVLGRFVEKKILMNLNAGNFVGDSLSRIDFIRKGKKKL